MGKDNVLNGVHIGEHSFEPDKIIDEIYERCIQPGYNFVTIRIGRKDSKKEIPQHYFLKWAEYLKENKIYFVFLYAVQRPPQGRDTFFDKETVEQMKEIAGEYFIGDMIGETGSSYACKFPGYFSMNDSAAADATIIKTDFPDMEAAHKGYIDSVGKYIETNHRIGMPDILSVEATALNKYNAEAGVTIPMLEMMCGNPDILVSALRGTARTLNSKMWGTYIAHEWYGGMRHDDILKRKRLELAYKYAYMAGSQAFCLESGDEAIDSFGIKYDKNSEICREYRKVLSVINDFIKTDSRPSGGPKVKVAFVSGLHDAWGGWGGSSSWNQFGRKEWGHSSAEFSWRILDTIGTKRSWADVANFGNEDTSALPAYGMYDIVPIEAPLEKLSQYNYLIFLGWNTMTDEIMDKLTEYVKSGGNLLMSAAHLNYSTLRSGEFIMPPTDKVEKLFGCRLTGKETTTNGGVKFRRESLNKDILYPATSDLVCDPIYSAGYTNYFNTELCGGCDTAFISEDFKNKESNLPAVIENRTGNGIATLVTSVDYPGNPSVYPLYNAIVREIISATARKCEIKIFGNDSLRYSVYENGKIYLLNTDYDIPTTVKIIKNKETLYLNLEPMELKTIDI